MTPLPDTLLQAKTGDFIGVFRSVPGESPDTPVIAVYEADLPEGIGDGIDAYRFRRATTIAGETIIDGQAVVTAAVEHPHRGVDGHTHAKVAVAAASSETAADESVVSVFRDPSQFGEVVGLLAERKPADVLDMTSERTNLGPDGVQALGFSAIGGRVDAPTFELQSSGAVAQAA